MLSDEDVTDLREALEEQTLEELPKLTERAVRELLAIRARAAQVLDRPLTTVVDLCGSATQADSELAERVAALVAYGEGAQAPERRYSEAEWVKALEDTMRSRTAWPEGTVQDWIGDALRRLRGEGEARADEEGPCAECTHRRKQGLGPCDSCMLDEAGR